MLGVLVAVALLLRIWHLEIKPPHFDEGINGHFVMRMWKVGYYHYDPTNFHGPLYFYFLQLSELIFGKGIFAFRFVTALMSVGIVYLVGLHRRFFGTAAIWAAAVIALSPGFVFYGRYAIHESLFILLQILFTYGFFLYREERSRSAFAMMVIGIFGSFAVKETFFIFYGTWAIAWLCVKIADRLFPTVDSPGRSALELDKKARKKKAKEEAAARPAPANLSTKTPATNADKIAIIVLGALGAVLFFSGFFMNPGGIGDMFHALAVWTKTGVGQTGHEKPMGYWVQLLTTYEWPFFIFFLASLVAFFFVNRASRAMILTAIGTFIAYSIIPYKTPWLILNMLWPMAFGLGIVLQKLGEPAVRARFAFARPLALLALLGSLGYSGYTMLRLNFKDFVKQGEPYVYVQTTMQFKNVMDYIRERVKQRPEDLNMIVKVLNRDTWPIPWTLGDFPNLQYGKPEDAQLDGVPVVLADGAADAIIKSKLRGRYWVVPFHIRDAYDPGQAYLDFEKFKSIVPADSPIHEGVAP